MRWLRFAMLLSTCALLVACAGLRPGLEAPDVRVTDVRSLPSEDIAPRFLVRLHVVNPNDVDLPLRGIVYRVSVRGRELISGASADLPLIPAYGEGDIELEATADVFGGIGLIRDLLDDGSGPVAYRVEAKLDVGFGPDIEVTKEGELRLR